MHPELETLMAWRDGELRPRASGRVARHVRQCERCREGADRIGRELDEFLRAAGTAGGETGFEVESGLATLLSRARHWRQKEAVTAEARRRLKAELEVLLGPAAADNLMQQAAGSPEEFQQHALRYLAAYLGQANAARVLTRVGFGPAPFAVEVRR